MFKTLSLFSGVGGIEYALKDVLVPQMYVEQSDVCCQILNANMQRGLLHRAPIMRDVREVTSKRVSLDFDFIQGGFPCQSISGANCFTRTGLQGTSGLFYEIMRIVDEFPCVKALFLENVSAIVNICLDEVLAELKARKFFAVAWVTLAASSLGAYHKRERWYCLAVRDPWVLDRLMRLRMPKFANKGAVQWNLQGIGSIPMVLLRRSFETKLHKDDKDHLLRNMTLGNSVVPPCVNKAFGYLRFTILYPQTATHPCPVGVLPPCGVLQGNGEVMAWKPEVPPQGRENFTQTYFTDAGEELKLSNFPTPRHGQWQCGTRCTKRSLNDIGVRLVRCELQREYFRRQYGVDLPVQALSKKVIVNANFIEWLMGFPQNWTRAHFPEHCTWPKKAKRAPASSNPVCNEAVPADGNGEEGLGGGVPEEEEGEPVSPAPACSSEACFQDVPFTR